MKFDKSSLVPKVTNQFWTNLVVGLIFTGLLVYGSEAESALDLAVKFAPVIIAALAGIAAGYQTTDPEREALYSIIESVKNSVNKENSIDLYMELVSKLTEDA